jgi:hypothetical protein
MEDMESNYVPKPIVRAACGVVRLIVIIQGNVE